VEASVVSVHNCTNVRGLQESLLEITQRPTNSCLLVYRKQVEVSLHLPHNMFGPNSGSSRSGKQHDSSEVSQSLHSSSSLQSFIWYSVRPSEIQWKQTKEAIKRRCCTRRSRVFRGKSCEIWLIYVLYIQLHALGSLISSISSMYACPDSHGTMPHCMFWVGACSLASRIVTSTTVQQ
jgi:hypothetical protein